MGAQEWRAVPAPRGSGLLEREHVLDRLEVALAAARDGQPQVLLLTGPAGAGKSSVLEVLLERVRASGTRACRARCGTQEQDYAFGAVRQLLGPPAPGTGRRGSGAPSTPEALDPDVPPPEPFGVLQALADEVLALAAAGPLLLAVDDAHWLDDPSLRWLLFVARRAHEVPLAVVLTARPGATERPLLAQLAAEAVTERLVLAPLSRAAAAVLLRRRCGRDVPLSFVSACHAASGGNPFYLSALAAGVREAGLAAVERGLARGHELPAVLSQAVLDRARALGPDVVALTRAVCVLGGEARPETVGQLAGLALPTAQDSAARAADAGLVRSGAVLRMAHPLLEAVVLDDLDAVERDRLHRAAARLLAATTADPERVALHLVETRPSEDLWVLESLLAGARDAAQRGAPETARRYLERALDEPAARRSSRVLLELGRAQCQAGDLAGLDRLREALSLADDDGLVVAAARPLARSLAHAGLAPDAVEVLQRARARLRDPGSDLALRLDLDAVAAGALDARTCAGADALLARLPRPRGDGPLDLLLCALLSLGPARAGTSASQAALWARDALADDRLVELEGPEAPVTYFPVIALFLADRLEEARRHLDVAVDVARKRGSVSGSCLATLWRSHVALRSGDVPAAEADARAGLAAAREAGLPGLLPYATAVLSDVLLESGDLVQAVALWEPLGPDVPLPPVLPSNYLLFSRGCLHLVRGLPGPAARDLLESGERQRALRAPGPGFWPWAARAALALHALGDTDRARALLAQEREAALAFGAARPLGLVLHAAALLEQGRPRADGLRQALEVLTGSPDRLAHARVLVDLGVAEARTGRTRQGEARLQQGLDGALRCGAAALAERAQAELRALGLGSARAVAGLAALTPSERRVAELVAAGLTNRAVASALFVTPKTVETHLSRVFVKLQLRSRHELDQVEGLRDVGPGVPA